MRASPLVTADSLRPHGLQPAHQAPLSVEFSRLGYWSGLPSPPPGDLPDPGIELGAPTLQADSLLSVPLGNPIFMCMYLFIHTRVNAHVSDIHTSLCVYIHMDTCIYI